MGTGAHTTGDDAGARLAGSAHVHDDPTATPVESSISEKPETSVMPGRLSALAAASGAAPPATSTSLRASPATLTATAATVARLSMDRTSAAATTHAEAPTPQSGPAASPAGVVAATPDRAAPPKPSTTGAPTDTGEASERPAAERATATPTVKPRKRRSPLWAKLSIGFGTLILIASLGAIGFLQAGLHTLNKSVRQENLLGNAAPGVLATNAPQLTGVSIDGPINILLVGVDTRPDWTSGSHSDTIIIAHIPASHDRAYLVSLPRDTGVAIPADPATGYSGGYNKINAAFTFGSRNGKGYAGGFQLLANTIKQDYGITFNGGAIIDFNGFKDIVDKLGGVNMYVDETTVSIHHGYLHGDPSQHAAPFNIDPNTGVPYCPHGGTFNSTPLKCAITGVTPVVYEKGYQHLSAYDALDYVRARDGLVGTDYARQRHQQQFIKAILQEAFNQGLSDPLKMTSFVQSIGKAFIFDGGGVSLNDWVFTLKGIVPSALTTIKTNGGQFVTYSGPYIPGSAQGLNADSVALLAAVRSDTGPNQDHVADFLAVHPDWIVGDGSG
jgi:LCP family protein required for cell wall assembly